MADEELTPAQRLRNAQNARRRELYRQHREEAAVAVAPSLLTDDISTDLCSLSEVISVFNF